MADDHFIAAKRCSTCGVVKPLSEFFRAACCKDGHRGECKPCVAAKQADYNKRNAEKIAAKKKEAYYADFAADMMRQKSAAYYQRNKDRIKRISREQYRRNAAKISAQRKENRDLLRQQTNEWRSKNREMVRQATRNWYHENKERLKPARRAAKAARRASGWIDAAVVSFLLVAQRRRCAACRCGLDESSYHLDHIEPIARGGTNERGNLQLLCPSCNLTKSAKDPVEFMQSRGYLI